MLQFTKNQLGNSKGTLSGLHRLSAVCLSELGLLGSSSANANMSTLSTISSTLDLHGRIK